jgi:hypothetical protein
MRMHRTQLPRAVVVSTVMLALALSLLAGIVVVSRLQARTQARQSASATALATSCQAASSAKNPVAAENTCQGTTTWQQDHPVGADDAVEAFMAPVSVDAGGTVDLFVSTTAPTYSFQVFRLGYYGGLGGRLMYTSARLEGIHQPAPTFDPSTRMVSCSDWQHPTAIRTGMTWVSGVYVVKLLASTGYMRYAMFVVRSDGSHSAILVQQSVLTYQAYNPWGGRSLYLGPGSSASEESAARSYVVSFDRPYERGAGLADFPQYDYGLVRWLEMQGYDLSYATDIDVDLRGTLLRNHRLILVAGHDEYWSTAMRHQVTDARDASVSLAFFGADDAYWHVRLQDSSLGPDREVVCYKSAALDPMAASDPQQATTRWRDAPLHEPENSVLGEMFAGAVGDGSADEARPLVLAGAAQPFLAGTGLQSGAAVPGIVGGEFDRPVDNGQAPASLVALATSPTPCTLCVEGTSDADATMYTSPSGARVFDAGTLYWAWGLVDAQSSPPIPNHSLSTQGFQRFTVNIIRYLLRE